MSSPPVCLIQEPLFGLPLLRVSAPSFVLLCWCAHGLKIALHMYRAMMPGLRDLRLFRLSY
jgi:hypothetical protein